MILTYFYSLFGPSRLKLIDTFSPSCSLTLNHLEQNEGNVVGRLLVLVVEAENLQASQATGKIHAKK